MTAPSPQAVASFLGRADDTSIYYLADEHLTLVTAFVNAYTRGRGFTVAEGPNDDLAAVIITATARLLTNPAQVERETADGYEAVGRLDGFTLPELAVLHRYRRRAA